MLLAPRAGRRSGRGPPSGDTMCGLETRGVGTGHERLARRRPQQLAREQISWRPPGTVPCTLIAHGQRQIQRLLRTPLLLRLRGMCLRLDYPCHSSISLLQLTLNRLTALASRSHTLLQAAPVMRYLVVSRSRGYGVCAGGAYVITTWTCHPTVASSRCARAVRALRALATEDGPRCARPCSERSRNTFRPSVF